MTNEAIARYTIGSITTKDLELWKRTRELMKDHTLEYILRRGIEVIEQEK